VALAKPILLSRWDIVQRRPGFAPASLPPCVTLDVASEFS
jgi:hypothetical protein